MMILKYLSLATLVVLYSLMFIGGYISAAGLGLTCPDWPLCPDGLLPGEKYLIEYIHRLVAASTGAMVLAMTVGSWLVKDPGVRIRVTSMLASALVVTQIALGALVIDLKLHAVLVAIHLGLGILLFAMVLLTALFAFRLDAGSPGRRVRTGDAKEGA